jgi:hypothetical protein
VEADLNDPVVNGRRSGRYEYGYWPTSVRVTPSTSVRLGENVVGEIHDIYREELEEILSRDAQGRVLVSQELDNRHQVFVNTPVEKRDPIMLLQTLPLLAADGGGRIVRWLRCRQ